MLSRAGEVFIRVGQERQNIQINKSKKTPPLLRDLLAIRLKRMSAVRSSVRKTARRENLSGKEAHQGTNKCFVFFVILIGINLN